MTINTEEIVRINDLITENKINEAKEILASYAFVLKSMVQKFVETREHLEEKQNRSKDDLRNESE